MTAPAFPASLYAPIPPNLGLPVKGKPVADGGGCGCGCSGGGGGGGGGHGPGIVSGMVPMRGGVLNAGGAGAGNGGGCGCGCSGGGGGGGGGRGPGIVNPGGTQGFVSRGGVLNPGGSGGNGSMGGGGCGCCCDSGGVSLTGGQGGCTAETSPIQTGGPGGGQTSPGGLRTVQPCYTADGTGDALDAATKVLMTNCKQAPPLGVPLGGGGPFISRAQVNPANGNLVIQWWPPPTHVMEPAPIMTYNSDSPAASPYGAGNFNLFNRTVTNVTGSSATVTGGDGTQWVYTNRNTLTGQYTPPPGTANTLQYGGSGGPITETQPDGTIYTYMISNGPWKLTSIFRPNGGTWGISRNAAGNISSVQNPAGDLTNFAYTGANNLRRTQDSAGRNTTYSVDGNGNLARVIMPDRSITSMGSIPATIC